MAVDTTTPRSRRALLAAAGGGLAALAAQTLGRPAAIRAADGDPVLLGQLNSETIETEIENTDPSGTALIGHSGTDGTGLQGLTSAGVGVSGGAGTGTGVYGFSGTGKAVLGHSESGSKPAILGDSGGANTGVQGWSGSGAVPAAPDKVGVFGDAGPDSDAATRGVYGRSGAGRGVHGSATSGKGVVGRSETGTGGYFSAGAGGTAFQAVGPVKFSSAGLKTIPSGSASALVDPGVPITTGSKVLCTLQTSAGGSTTVKRVQRDPIAGKFTIYLTAPAASNCVVAWFVIA